MPASAPPCPVCRGETAFPFLDRSSVVVHQNLLFDSAEAARGAARGRLRMSCCEGCGFVWNVAFDEDLLSYGASYDNLQTESPAFQRHVDQLVTRLVEEEDVRDCTVVEVGCGNGGFIRRLIEYEGAENRGYGFDPSYVGPRTELDGRLRFEVRQYDESASNVRADVVLCRHVIEHVADPVGLLRTVRRALVEAPAARVYFETPCVRWILEQVVVWDLFYEHCSLFTAGSLRRAFESAGFRVREVGHVFGGQYLWLEATPTDRMRPGRVDADEVPRLAREFGRTEAQRLADWRARLRDWSEAGPVVLWGAGAKGVTFSNLADPAAEHIDLVVDINPAKQGRFLAGTGLPIVAPEELARLRPAFALILNPNYSGEIQRALARHSPATQAVDLMEKS